MQINYSTEDKSINIQLVYIVKNNMRMYRGIGKSWPKQTQCLLFYNGILKSFGLVTKHIKDEDNPAFAHKLATKKALEGQLRIKWLRKELWKLVLSELENLKP